MEAPQSLHSAVFKTRLEEKELEKINTRFVNLGSQKWEVDIVQGG